MDLDLSTGSAIRAARKAAGLSQVKLAELMGKHPSWVYQLERGATVAPAARAKVQEVLRAYAPQAGVTLASELDAALHEVHRALQRYHDVALRHGQSARPAPEIVDHNATQAELDALLAVPPLESLQEPLSVSMPVAMVFPPLPAAAPVTMPRNLAIEAELDALLSHKAGFDKS